MNDRTFTYDMNVSNRQVAFRVYEHDYDTRKTNKNITEHKQSHPADTWPNGQSMAVVRIISRYEKLFNVLIVRLYCRPYRGSSETARIGLVFIEHVHRFHVSADVCRLQTSHHTHTHRHKNASTYKLIKYFF